MSQQLRPLNILQELLALGHATLLDIGLLLRNPAWKLNVRSPSSQGLIIWSSSLALTGLQQAVLQSDSARLLNSVASSAAHLELEIPEDILTSILGHLHHTAMQKVG